MTVGQHGAGRRITFVISALDVGGAERVMSLLANAWVGDGHAVTILTFDGPRTPFFPIRPEVTVRPLDLIGVSRGLVSAVRNNLRRMAVVRRAIVASRPDVVISFMDRTSIVVLLATVGRREPVIVSDRTAGDPTSGRIWRSLRRLSYRRAAAIVLQTAAMAADIQPELRRRVTVIPNPLPDHDPTAPVGSPVDGLVVAVGRLVPQKGYDRLIEAFGRVATRCPDARLEIWGEGPERADLEGRIAALGLPGRIDLAGQTDQPDTVLGRASVVVLSSRIEGFPNVLLEAMALGRPVVALDCRYGPAEIVRDGVDGRLVPEGDPSAFADAIVELLESPARRLAMGERAIEVRRRFALGAIRSRWDDLIDDVLARRRRA